MEVRAANRNDARGPSLFEQMARLRRPRTGDAEPAVVPLTATTPPLCPAADAARLGWRREWTPGAVLAGLIAAGPALTLFGALLLGTAADRDAERLRAAGADRAAALAGQDQARETLRRLYARPALGATIERIAAVLPAEARLVSAARDADGRLVLDVATLDPDRLRGALRRASVPGLRETRQRREGSGMLVTLEAR